MGISSTILGIIFAVRNAPAPEPPLAFIAFGAFFFLIAYLSYRFLAPK
jgi:hypothetical protein